MYLFLFLFYDLHETVTRYLKLMGSRSALSAQLTEEAQEILGDHKEDQSSKALIAWMCFFMWHFVSSWDFFQCQITSKHANLISQG